MVLIGLDVPKGGAGVWNAFAFAFVVFIPKGARLRGANTRKT